MRRIAALASAGVVLLGLILAQLFLPGIAAQSLRDRLSKNGTVIDVQVSAFPAIELLWHRADRVVVRIGSYRSGTGPLSSLLDQAANVGTLDVSAAELSSGLLTLRHVSLTKRGDQLLGRAQVTEADLRSSIPFLDGVVPVASAGGQLTLRGTATILGVTASVDATVGAVNGRLEVAPNVPFGALATVTVFADPHVQVQGVSATGAANGFSVLARATLR